MNFGVECMKFRPSVRVRPTGRRTGSASFATLPLQFPDTKTRVPPVRNPVRDNAVAETFTVNPLSTRKLCRVPPSSPFLNNPQ